MPGAALYHLREICQGARLAPEPREVFEVVLGRGEGPVARGRRASGGEFREAASS